MRSAFPPYTFRVGVSPVLAAPAASGERALHRVIVDRHAAEREVAPTEDREAVAFEQAARQFARLDISDTMDRATDFRRDAPVMAAAIRGVVGSLGMTLCLTAVASGREMDVAAKLVPDVTAVPSAPPLQSTIDPTAAPPCAGALCGLEQSWKRGILPPGFKASGANDFKVENASGVILGRARAAETERLYEPAPLKLDYKFLGMKCEIGTFTVRSSQEGGTRCLF